MNNSRPPSVTRAAGGYKSSALQYSGLLLGAAVNLLVIVATRDFPADTR